MGAFLGTLAFLALYGATQFGLPIVLAYFACKPRGGRVSPTLLVTAAFVAVAANVFWRSDVGLELSRVLQSH
jgi:hypothetical protein